VHDHSQQENAMKRITRHSAGGIRGLFAAVSVLLTLATGLTSAVTAGPSHDEPASSAAKPTIVLVHGGWADSSGWNKEIARLQERGYPVIAVANPLRGLAADAAYVRSVLQTIAEPIVLVGHSYGGAVITNAAVGVPNVKALVFIAAFAPDAGESLAGLVTKNPGTQIGPTTLTERPYPLPDGTTGVDLYINASAFHDAFAGDLPLATTRVMQAEQRPFSVAAFTEASGTPAWTTIPSWYLVTTQDHAIPPATQRFMAKRAHAHITEVPASHVPMISHPGTTTQLILQAAEAIG
jgi:pimeloyl-ACP methyl ester carboxylesterase